MRILFTVLVLILAFTLKVTGQDYFFRQYTHEEGLQHPFVYSINQDPEGFLWIGTGEGLYRFNGFDFNYFSTENGLGDNFITTIFRDHEGRLWLGHQNGSVSVLSGKDFIVLNESSEASGSVSHITEDDQGFIWAAVQNQGLVMINKSFTLTPVEFSIQQEPLSHINYLGNAHFLIGSQENLYLSRYQSASGSMVLLNRIEGYPGSRVVEIFPESPGNYLVVSQDEGLYHFAFDSLTLDFVFSTIDDNRDGVLDNLQGGLIDGRGTLWLNSMGNGLIKYRGGQGKAFTRAGTVSSVSGLVSDNVRSVFEDLEGNLWFGMYGEGLLRYVDNNLAFYSYQTENGSNRTYTVTGDESSLLTVTDDSLLRINPADGTVLNAYPLAGKHAGDRARAAYLGEDGRLWLGFEQSGLTVSGPSGMGFRPVFLSNDDLANSVNHITGQDGYIWVGTKKGVFRITPETGNTRWFTTADGLPHNNIQQLYPDSKGRVLVATQCSEIHYINQQGGVARLDDSRMGSYTSMASVLEDNSGIIWAGTQGNGIWKIVEEGNINYTRASGLISDFCYSLTITEEGMPVIGHRGGISRIDPVTNRIKTLSRLEGVKSSAEFYPNAIFADNRGSVWFGTSEGLVRYTSALSTGGRVPPMLNINALYVDGEQVELTAGPVLLKAGLYELVVDYIGINFTNPEMVIYQTKLEGYNKNWSALTSGRRVVYDRVGHGEYEFRIRAFNENDIGSEITSAFNVKIKKPVYLTVWFYFIIVILIGFAFYTILKSRERKQKQFQELLQLKLDERTLEVVHQKEKIELINKDITASIRYAQTIQASILPPIGRLKDIFAGAFLYYQPKDIVSGDFYWYKEFENNKIIVICADSTGHGVPGAFMSMIGTTLFKDISSNPNIQSPSVFLEYLDEELMAILSQNIETDKTNDGMDLVVVEIDLKTNILRIAAAISSLILYKGQEQIYVRGSKSSIGGQNLSKEKIFETQVFELSKGDKIYMYSDGYADQFGGPEGKKIKMAEFKKILENIHDQPMDTQYEFIKNNFEKWKEGTEQLDDVLVMGIEI